VDGDQLSLVPPAIRRPPRPAASPGSPAPLAELDPVAQVRIDAPVPHLDRIFDYAVPASMGDAAVVGARVRVRFAGRLTDGFVVGRLAAADHGGTLRPLERVVGTEPVLTAQTLELVEQVAARYAGTFSDVVRAAVPPRHARAERVEVEPVADYRGDVDDATAAKAWAAYDRGPALLQRLSAPGSSPTRATWSAAPASRWPEEVAGLVRAVLAQPVGGVVVVVPDSADVESVLAALAVEQAAGVVATLTADVGPERRYREFVRVLRGGARVVVGTRAAVFAPVADLRLLVLWDDGDDALADPQAPYWDAREVAALRSHLAGCDLVVGSPSRSVVTQQWCTTGWAQSVTPSRACVLERGPKVRALSADDAARDPAAAAARIPHMAWQAARAALREGPVLVQVARRGYVPALACQRCREPARCAECGGPLRLDAFDAVPACGWCGKIAGDWSCAMCSGRRLRAVDVGSERTAEEIGRAFAGVPVVASHAGHIVAQVSDAPQIVVATPGAEPSCPGGFRAVLLLDARSQLERPGLAAGEDAARRWFAACRLAAPGARVVITAPNAAAPVQALVRWDAPWLADREMSDRTEAGLPPATRVALLLGAPADIEEVSAAVGVPHRLLGPVPLAGSSTRQRGVVVVERAHGAALALALRSITATRSARSSDAPVHVQLDPREL
jgi:primosomal protein N' (replication factor Y)